MLDVDDDCLWVLQGFCQSAREMLREAHLAGESLGDVALTARTLYLLGRLAFIEGQYKQAVSFCTEAQVQVVGVHYTRALSFDEPRMTFFFLSLFRECMMETKCFGFKQQCSPLMLF